MMDPEEPAEHDQLPNVEEYKANVGHRSSPSKSLNIFSNGNKARDPDGHHSGAADFSRSDPDGEAMSLTPNRPRAKESNTHYFPNGEQQRQAAHVERKTCSLWKACSIGVFVLLIVIIVTVVLVVSPEEIYEDFWHFLQGETEEYLLVKQYLTDVSDISESYVFENATSPQYLAAQWMAHGDRMKLPVPESQDMAYDERYVMVVMFFAMGGQNWSHDLNFLNGGHICTWFQEFKKVDKDEMSDETVLLGVHGCKRNEATDELYPTSVYIPNNGIVGTIPEEIKGLQRLEYLNLEFNVGLGGYLPSGLTSLESLNHLEMQWCSLGGSLPEWIGLLTNLEYLGLGNNDITGTVPTEIAYLTKLELLGLDDNSLFGLVDYFAPLTNLRSLYLERNFISGSISDSLMYGWPKLEELDISDSFMYGTLPEGFFNHENKDTLQVIDLHGNTINGTIPFPAANNFDLEFLALYSNGFYGEVPQSFTSFKSMKHLDISQNKLTGTLPEKLGEMTTLEYLFAGTNAFEPTEFPKFLIELTSLRELSLKSSQLTGTLPDFIHFLEHLIFLDLHDNNLNGNLPDEIGELEKLRHLILKDNSFEGGLPSTFKDLSNLQLLLIEQNKFGGSADVICQAGFKVDHFVADCGDSSGVNQGIECSCCDLCCDVGDETCNDWDWKGNLDPIWEYGFRRQRYSYDLGPVVWMP